MIYTEDDIKKDLLKTNVKEFYMKYLLRADNWYFERISMRKILFMQLMTLKCW